jgi:glutaredoxin
LRPPPQSESIDVLVVGSAACGHCRDAKLLLDDLGRRYPLDVRELDMATEEGTAIVRRYGVPFPPAVLVDGEFFGYGRISRRKLESRLDDLVGEN